MAILNSFSETPLSKFGCVSVFYLYFLSICAFFTTMIINKVDIFSFGVVLMEILWERRSIHDFQITKNCHQITLSRAQIKLDKKEMNFDLIKGFGEEGKEKGSKCSEMGRILKAETGTQWIKSWPYQLHSGTSDQWAAICRTWEFSLQANRE